TNDGTIDVPGEGGPAVQVAVPIVNNEDGLVTVGGKLEAAAFTQTEDATTQLGGTESLLQVGKFVLQAGTVDGPGGVGADRGTVRIDTTLGTPGFLDWKGVAA